MRLSLVVPVFNETARIAEFAPELVKFIGRQEPGSELIFVDDGSDDDTAERLEQLVAPAPAQRVQLLRRPHQGKGAAVAAGLRASHGEIRAFCDLDLSTPLADLERVIEVAARAEVLAIGSRDLASSVLVEPESKVREALGRLYNRLMQATVTPGVVDTQCGAKAAQATVWDRLLSRCQQTGFAWDAELIAVAIASGIVVQEVSIQWSHDERSRVRVLRDGIAMVAETPRIWTSARRARAATTAVRPVPAEVQSGEIFNEVNASQMQAADRTHWWFRSKAAFVATALRRTDVASPREQGWLVDAGGGSGSVTAMLGWPTDRAMVVEGNRTLVSTAHHELGLGALRGSVHALPLADHSADVVSLLDVIEHLEDPRAALAEARRVLRADGRLIINVPAHAWLWSDADVALGHHRRYTRRLLRQQLRDAEFEPELLTHVFSWLVPPVWVVRRLARPSGAELGLDRRSLPIDVASLVLTAVERLAIGRITVPLGTSVLCVARPNP